MTRRKKYAIMMKTRCAKGENAVENLIPRWYRELELFRGVKPLLVLEGCVMDQVRVPVTGSVAEDTLLPLSAFLNAYLSDAGYEQVVFYSNLVGLMNPYAPEMLDNFAKTNQAEVVSGAIPAEFKGNEANTAPNIIRRAIEEPMRQIAHNAGFEGSVVVEKVRNGKDGFGFNAATGEYEDLFKAGVIDPKKVVPISLPCHQMEVSP